MKTQNKAGCPAKPIGQKKIYRINIKMDTPGSFIPLKPNHRRLDYLSANVSANLSFAASSASGLLPNFEVWFVNFAEWPTTWTRLHAKPIPWVTWMRGVNTSNWLTGSINWSIISAMMAKIVKWQGFKGVVNYILDKAKGTEILDNYGFRIKSTDTIIQSFIFQSELNPRLIKPVGHISLDFSAQDREKLTNEFMV